MFVDHQVFRQFPGNHLSGIADSRFACEYVDEDGLIAPCYDPTVRDWCDWIDDVLLSYECTPTFSECTGCVTTPCRCLILCLRVAMAVAVCCHLRPVSRFWRP